MGKQVSLVYLVRSGPVGDPVSSKKADGDRETTAEVGLWPPYTGTHMSVNTHMQRKGKATGTQSRKLVRKHQ